MPSTLSETATALSRTFMPAEKAQRSAAEGAAAALVLALEAEKLPGFRKATTGPAKEALALGVLLSVQADEALRKAHREFAKIIPNTDLRAEGWGCTTPNCDPGAFGESGDVVALPQRVNARQAA